MKSYNMSTRYRTLAGRSLNNVISDNLSIIASPLVSFRWQFCRALFDFAARGLVNSKNAKSI